MVSIKRQTRLVGIVYSVAKIERKTSLGGPGLISGVKLNAD